MVSPLLFTIIPEVIAIPRKQEKQKTIHSDLKENTKTISIHRQHYLHRISQGIHKYKQKSLQLIRELNEITQYISVYKIQQYFYPLIMKIWKPKF